MAMSLIKKKPEQKLTISAEANKIFKVIYERQNDAEAGEDDTPRLKVSTLISKMAFYYEKIRNSVDYKEDHLLRKNAVMRILKRQLIIEGAVKAVNSREIAEHLLAELIRAAYLPNNSLPEAKIGETAVIIDKYIDLRRHCIGCFKGESEERTALTNFIIGMAASEIEDGLARDKVGETATRIMFETLSGLVKLPDGSPLQDDLEVQILIGSYATFMKFDRERLAYLLFKYYNPGWSDAVGETVTAAGRDLLQIKQAVDRQLDHPLQRQLGRILARYTVYFTILIDVVDDDPVKVYRDFEADPKAFPRLVKQKCVTRYKSAKKKLWRAAFRSIIYIFLTKSVFAVILEVPVIRWFGDELNYLNIFINVTFPPVLLFLIVFFTKLPGEDNSDKIIEGINEIVFVEKKRKDAFVVRPPAKRGGFTNAIFGLFYAVTYFLSFGFIIWALGRLQFNWVSTTIFLFFLALVSFFSIRIRRGAKDLVIVESKENIWGLFLDFFYTPVVVAGKWLSENFSRVNVFVFVLDFIIEAPFKIFVQIAEDWSRYVRERRDEIM